MACGPCIDKLAYKLMSHHNIDMIRAFELAEKGVERFERVQIPSEVKSGNPTDYQRNCVSSGTCSCKPVGTACASAGQCLASPYTCACSCPPPSDPNSHYVSNNCTITRVGCPCNLITHLCVAGACVCGCSGRCNYDCDDGYVWNPATLQCELGEARWDGYYFLDPG